MGTKRPSCTVFDTLPNINMSDRKLQPGGKISRDPSPRPGKTAQSERDRGSDREQEWRRETETEKIKDKARSKDIDTRERYYGRVPESRMREDERGWRERERRQGGDRSRNGRPLSNFERNPEIEGERGKKKGDTFPRMRKSSPDHGRRMISNTLIVEEKGESRQRDKPRRMETEREKVKTLQKDRHDSRGRAKEEGKKSRARPEEDHKSRQRGRYSEYDAGFQDRGRARGDSLDRRERDPARKREMPRPDLREREAKMTSPHRRRDREHYSNRKVREEAERREKCRATRSEGDSDERDLRKERVRDRAREELIYQHSKSEGDNTGKIARQMDPNWQGHGEQERQRDREREVDRTRRRGEEKDRERYREVDRRADREGERWRESGRDPKDRRTRSNDRKEDDRHKQRRDRERKEREADPRWDSTTGRSNRSRNEMAPRVPPRSHSSGDWSSDMDNEVRYRRGRDSYEEGESGRESERDVEEPKDPADRSRREQKRSERQERERGEMSGCVPEQRRMWLEPQRGKNSEGENVDRERLTGRKERRREEERSMVSQQVKEEPDEMYLDQSSCRQRDEDSRGEEREKESVSLDGEEVRDVWRETDKGGKEYQSDSSGGMEGGWQGDVEGANTTDNTEESDREEEGGIDCLGRSKKGGGGSESGWTHERESVVSGEDGFVTVSSGGDEEDEREEDGEEEFEDCQEFLEGAVQNDGSPLLGFKGCEGDEERVEGRTTEKVEAVDEEQGKGNQQKFVFCVIGQTLPRSRPGDKSLSQVDPMGVVERDNPSHRSEDVAQQPQDDQRSTRSRNDDKPTTNNPDTEGKGDLPREERGGMGKTTGEKSSIEPEDTESGEGILTKVENPYAEIVQIKRDSQTEKLLVEWREKTQEPVKRGREPLSPANPYADFSSPANFEQIQPILEGMSIGVMSPEEVEAIRIRMSGAWSMSEEPKRHSQAPHLKWAKNVVKEILGKSEEEIGDGPNAAVQDDKQEEEDDSYKIPFVKMTTIDLPPNPELDEEEVRGGMGQSQADMHADQLTAMHGDTPTHTHADTPLDTAGREEHNVDQEAEPPGNLQLEEADIEVKITPEGGEEVTLSEKEKEEIGEKEIEMYLSVSNTLYKPSSCPILNFESDSDLLLAPSTEGESQEEEDEEEEEEEEDGMGESEEERQGGEADEGVTAGEVGETGVVEETAEGGREGEVVAEKQKGATLKSTCSFQDLGAKARIRRRGIRKTTERRNLVEAKEEESVGRDRRTRIFSTPGDDDWSKSCGEVELRNVLDTVGRRKRNSKFFNAAQLYQQYSEAAQNFEILRQARSDVVSVCEDNAPPSPAPSPPPARRPLPPLPAVPHPHSLSHTGSVTSVKSLPVPEPTRKEGRPSSPRLSITLSESATLWRDLPGVRDSGQLEDLSEDERRLQEVRFEVVTSEASYCRSLDIVVEHFVKCKHLGALLTTQDRNWLFSRLADVRAISHSFLSKLEERVETEIVHFTVCDIIARHCQRFKMVYVPYLTNQSYQDATYQRLMNENPGFKRIVDKLERSPVCQRLPLRSFLVLPFQRITRIKLLVQNIVKRTTPGTAEVTQAIKAMKLLEKLIQESNDSITQMESIESLVSLSAKVDFDCRTLPLISQSRRLKREGPVTQLMDFSLKDRERSVYLHLFNDYLLLSLQKEGGRFTVIEHSPVSDLRVENCRVKLHSLQKNLFRLQTSNKSLLLRTDTQSDKLRWISALSGPHPEIDFSAAQDFPQMQCIRAFNGPQPDELALEKADIILVHQKSSDHWVEGTRLSDRHHGWVPESHLETISNSRVRQRNLSDALKLTTATAAV